MKIAILAEKPGVAREIATIVGANSKQEGYMEGKGYYVTWAFGHLVQLVMPEEYGMAGFRREHLPVLPEEFILVPRQFKAEKGYKNDPSALKQLKIIQAVLEKCDRIIVATDAGREGELIFRHIYEYVECTKPFDRLWISSLTEKTIKEGLQNLKAGQEYDNLYRAAQARSEADWLIGINASQALSIAAGRGVYSLGRVQTPTLAIICKRYVENTNFVPVPYRQLQIGLAKDGKTITALSKEKIDSKTDANNIYASQQLFREAVISKVECKEVQQEPPLLYDLTTLQKEANSKHGFSAGKTLSLAQQLYEQHKLITYPRTGSRYIPGDVFQETGELIENLKSYPRFASYAGKLSESSLNIHSVDDKKVTDHHALLITENRPGKLSFDEQTIYEMIAGRMLEAFSRTCVKDITTLTLSVDTVLYETKGSVTKIAGWREVFNEQEEDGEDKTELPELSEGETLSIKKLDLLTKQTQPKPLHTEASLLSAMQTAGKE
ncbi:DNA topoisomerase 3, partial [termite gut metagenome]